MDIHFNCARCGQNLSVDEKGAGLSIECPTCKGRIPVPARPARSTPPPVLSSPSTPPSQSPAPASSGPSITWRSAWSDFFRVIGVLCLLGGMVGYVIAADSGDTASLVVLFVGFAGCLNAFFFAFLLDVFTDIRWFLKQLVDKQ